MNTEKNISEIMTKDVVTVHAEDSVAKVQKIFGKNAFHHLVVNDDRGFCGIISNNDMLDMFNEAYQGSDALDLENLKAKDIMTDSPMTIDIDDSIGFAADIFLANHLHALPILDDGLLVGIVTDYDLLRFAFDRVWKER